jgi:hypothetical protein
MVGHYCPHSVNLTAAAEATGGSYGERRQTPMKRNGQLTFFWPVSGSGGGSTITPGLSATRNLSRNGLRGSLGANDQGAPSMRARVSELPRWSFERGFNCGLKIRMIPSNWLMQSVFGESGFLRCQSPSIQSPQQLEPPQGTAQTLANTRKAKFQWIEEWIGEGVWSASRVTAWSDLHETTTVLLV